MFVMSTAGHIDHGKSTLVQALTGIDPDRLREEKERGMTIDLGFAWLKLPSGRDVGIVDVPGHERFVGNMLAGVGGIDLTLVVVAANEGVMPQTREHVSILDLLEIKKGVIAITKKDLVDDEWLSLVKMDIEELIKPTTLVGSAIIPVSAVNKDGLTQLLTTIDQLLEHAEPRKDLGRPRLPIDRVFTISGAGTIVTGTLIDGSLETGQEIEIMPDNLKSRIRGLQIHKNRTSKALPGNRVAVNLTGLGVSDIERGDVITRPGYLIPSTLVTGKLRLLGYINHPLRHSTEVAFYTGAAEVLAKVRLLEDDELKPGATAWAQFVLDKPVPLLDGDHFVIRSTTDTLGGGRIIEAHAKQLRRRRPEILQRLNIREEGSTEDIILTLIETKQPVELSSLSFPKLQPEEVRTIVEELIQQKKVIAIGQGEQQLFMTNLGWENTIRRSLEFIRDYHKKYPIRPGIPKEELRNKLKLGSAGNIILTRLIEDHVITNAGTEVHLPSFKIELNQAQKNAINAFLITLIKNPYNPPSESILEPDLINLLMQQNKVVKVSEDVVFSTTAYDEMVNKVITYLKTKDKASLAEVRDLLNTSRKYAIALLEHLDGRKITRRVEDNFRVLYQR
jgi:selenocysteine-specific elongation factor